MTIRPSSAAAAGNSSGSPTHPVAAPDAALDNEKTPDSRSASGSNPAPDQDAAADHEKARHSLAHRLGWVPLVAAAIGALAILGAAMMTPITGELPTLGGGFEVEEAPQLPSFEQDESIRELPEPEEPRENNWLRPLGIIVGAIGIVVAIVVILRLISSWTRPTDAGSLAQTWTDAEGEEALTAQQHEELDRGIVQAMALLGERGTLQDAVIHAWLAIEDAAAASGYPRQPWQTSTEFTAALLRRGEVDDESVSALMVLFQRARYSSRSLNSADIADARTHLARIHASWQKLRVPSERDQPTPHGSAKDEPVSSGPIDAEAADDT